MAYQKLQAGRAWAVNKSDNTDIPNIGIAGPTGATTTGSATQLNRFISYFFNKRSQIKYDRC